jgi:carboxyl-terminal processing protease
MLRRRLVLLLLVAASAPLSAFGRQPEPVSKLAAAPSSGTQAARRFELILQNIEDSSTLDLIGEETWSSLVARHKPGIESARTHRAFARAVNNLFDACGCSHFEYFTRDDFSYWHLLSAFEMDGRESRVEHAGLFAERIGGRWFLRGIFEGSPADGSGIRVGDELLSVDGVPYRPIASFQGKAGRPVIVKVRRRPGLTCNLQITPVKESLHEALVRAMHESIKVVQHDGFLLAYMHGWVLLGPGDEYEALLRLQPVVDGLLLDYRDGFGGRPDVARRFLAGNKTKGTESYRSPRWSKPVVVLIAGGTRSAKELVVAAARAYDHVTLLGTPTPGEVTSVGGLVPIGEDGLLMLPGHRFPQEGQPILPEIRVDRDIRYGAGADPQLQAAKDALVSMIARGLAVHGACEGVDAGR